MTQLTEQEILFTYTVRLADNALVLGHRLSEWCGFGPFLEEDIGMINTALDLLGRCRMLYQYAGEVEGKGRSEDDLAFHRDEREFTNYLLMEQPKGDFAYTTVRQFFADVWNLHFYTLLCDSKDERLAAIAQKVVKEARYHFRHNAEWIKRLGDGTEESHQRMNKALEQTSRFVNEMFEMDEVDVLMLEAGIGVDLAEVKTLWLQSIDEVLTEATLQRPEPSYDRSGGRKGMHTEHMGFMLAEMQYIQRCNPGLSW